MRLSARRVSKPVSVTGSEDGDSVSVASGVHVRRSEAERKAYLEADSNAQDIEDHQATCKACGKTVKLGNAIKYTLGPWIKHQERCSGAVFVFAPIRKFPCLCPSLQPE